MSDVSLVREDGATSYQLMSASDYLVAEGLPEHSELVKGKVIEMTPPSGRHGQVCNRIAYLLTRHADDHQSGHVLTNDTGVQTTSDPDTVRGADVAYLSFKKHPKGPLPNDYSFGTPEVVFEVLSKTDRWSNVFKKIGEYLEVGVEVVAIVEPELNSVRCFRADGTDVTVSRDTVLKLPEIQRTFEIKVSDLFA